jgi:predicted glutamine amidotransferase
MLAGWFNPDFGPEVDRARLFKHLMRKAQAGGDKSFGVAYKKDGKNKLERYVGPASQWLAQNEKEIADIAKSPYILGHTRLPTQGAVTKQNCHPFRIGDWYAAHNGCISNSKELMMKSRFVPNGETDSEEALCYIVSEKFSLDSMDKITGSYAFEAVKVDGSEAILAVNSVAKLHMTQVGRGWVWTTSMESLISSLVAAGYEPKKVYDMSGFKLHMPSGLIEEMPTASYHVYNGSSYGGSSHYSGGRWQGGEYKTAREVAEEEAKNKVTKPDPEAVTIQNAEELEAQAWLEQQELAEEERIKALMGTGGGPADPTADIRTRKLWPGAKDDGVDQLNSDVPPKDIAKELGLPLKDSKLTN